MAKAPLELSDRLRVAHGKGKGLQLTAADVVELIDSITSMSQVIQTLGQQALKASVPPELCIDLVANILCLQYDQGLSICVESNGHATLKPEGEWPMSEGDTLIAAIDQHRDRSGKQPLTAMEVILPGSVILEQIMASLAS